MLTLTRTINNQPHEQSIMYTAAESINQPPAASPVAGMNHLESATPAFSRVKSRGRHLLYAALFLLPLLPVTSQAVVLNWNDVTWTNGTYSQSFDIDPNHAGNDITVSLSLTGGAYTNNPAVNSTFTGGVSSNNKSLALLPDFSSQSGNIQVTITFLYANGVNNASFSLFDIDKDAGSPSTWQDQVRNFTGLSVHNSSLGATSVTGSSDNSVTSGNSSVFNPFVATGTANAPNSGTGSSAGNVSVDYSQTGVKSISFTYGSGSAALSNPNAQGIGLGNISFTPSAAPEINPGLGSILGCAVALALYCWRRRSQQNAASASAAGCQAA